MVVSRFFLSALFGLVAVSAAPSLAPLQSVSPLTAAQIAMYKPYTRYASTAYCNPVKILAWNCGANCNANPTFKPVASGGDGGLIQYWYVGYDPILKEVIVGYQGTDLAKLIPICTNLDFFMMPLDSYLFHSINSTIEVHNGFKEAQEKSAGLVLKAVQTALSRTGASKVTIVGHSLGGAIALITSVFLPIYLPRVTFKTITYGAPRVGNKAFADYLDAKADVTRINNKYDFIPIVPGQIILGPKFVHPRGEKHIIKTDAWYDCPGQDNNDPQCAIGYVPLITDIPRGIADHSGPYDGITIGC